MDVKHLLTASAALVVALTLSVGVAGPVAADPPPSPASPTPPLKAMKCWPYGRVGPGSARGGGGVPVYPPPCPPGTPH